MLKTCLKRKYIKNSNFIQAMKNSACPKPKFKRRPNLSESRICPNTKFPKCAPKPKFKRRPNLYTKCSEVWIEHTT